MNLSIKQAAEKANVSIPTIHNWIKSGKLSASKLGKAWQIPLASLDLCLGSKPPSTVLTDEAFAQIASKVVAELKPLLEQTFAIQQGSQTKTTELDSRVTTLEKALAELKQSLTSQTSNAKPSSTPAKPNVILPDKQQGQEAGQVKAEPVISQTGQVKKADQPDAEKAEKWARENLQVWIDQPCPYGKASGRTWRDLAANHGAKISLKGIESAPRAYLHAIEKWQGCESVWTKIKAKIALEVVNKETNGQSHYSHSAEIGG